MSAALPSSLDSHAEQLLSYARILQNRNKTMKKKSIIGVFVSLLGLGMTTTSCEDMLTPDMDLYTENFSGRDTINFYYGILSNVQDMVENNILLGDLRSDMVDTTSYVSDTVARISNFDKVEDGDNGLLNRSAYYKVINQCNFYIAKADTMAKKNNNYYMRCEYAQVQMVRAWTYMQLVQNYGEVPFITKPVDNANTGWEKNPEEGFVSVDNLLSKLMKAGLMQAYNYSKKGTPAYPSVNNGAMNIDPKKFVFQPDIIMGDLYLMRGDNQQDYEMAAQYYYNFIEEEARLKSNVPSGDYCGLSKNTFNGKESYEWSSAGSYSLLFADRGSKVGSDVITLMASAANSSFGTVLTRAAQIYGFDANSTTSSSIEKDDDGKDEEVASGKISISANFKNRQVSASKSYLNLSESQLAHFNEGFDNVTDVKYIEIGDGRINGNLAKFNTTVGKMTFVTKRAFVNSGANYTGSFSIGTGSCSYNYTFPLYRLRQIYLRFAEAVNRAGYPRYAYAILRDGLSSKTIPSILTDSINENNQIVPYASRVVDGASYIDINELRRAKNMPWLDFNSESYFDKVQGIHETGCNVTSDKDTLSLYHVVVGQRIAAEEARSAGTAVNPAEVLRYTNLLQKEGTNVSDVYNPTGALADAETGETPAEPLPAADPVIPASIGKQINAVESLICDEMALETAFEGCRFYDLTRIARHKNKDTWGYATPNFGTNWFAWTIARRSVNAKPYENMNEFNGALYTKLQNQSNWYLKNPVY